MHLPSGCCTIHTCKAEHSAKSSTVRGCLKTYQSAKVIPNLRYVWVQTDRSGIGIKRITILVDLIVKDADRAPESRITSVAIDGLLIRLVCF